MYSIMYTINNIISYHISIIYYYELNLECFFNSKLFPEYMLNLN